MLTTQAGDEGHFKTRLPATTFAVICQIANSLESFDKYKEYIIVKLGVDNVEFGTWDNSDQIKLILKFGNQRRDLMKCINLWIPKDDDSEYGFIFKNQIFLKDLRDMVALCKKIMNIFTLDEIQLQDENAFDFWSDILVPFAQTIFALSREQSITPYIRSMLTDLPIGIMIAKGLNLPLTKLFSAEGIEALWKEIKWMVR